MQSFKLSRAHNGLQVCDNNISPASFTSEQMSSFIIYKAARHPKPHISPITGANFTHMQWVHIVCVLCETKVFNVDS